MKPLIIKESEKVTEKTLAREVLKIGGISFKWLSTNKAGVPDRLCFFPKAIFKLVEVKSEGLKPSVLQAVTFKVLAKLGFPVYVIDTREGVMNFIAEVQREISAKGTK